MRSTQNFALDPALAGTSVVRAVLSSETPTGQTSVRVLFVKSLNMGTYYNKEVVGSKITIQSATLDAAGNVMALAGDLVTGTARYETTDAGPNPVYILTSRPIVAASTNDGWQITIDKDGYELYCYVIEIDTGPVIP